MPPCEYIMFAFQEKSYHWIEDWGLHTLGIAPDPGGYTSQRARIHDSKTGGGGRCPQRRQEHHQVNQVTSQVSLRKIFVYSSPGRFQSSRDARGYRFLLTTKRGEHQARKEQFMLAQGQGVDYNKRLVKLSSRQVWNCCFNQAIKRARKCEDHRVMSISHNSIIIDRDHSYTQ